MINKIHHLSPALLLYVVNVLERDGMFQKEMHLSVLHFLR